MTAVPNETSLGLTRWMRIDDLSERHQNEPATWRANLLKKPAVATPASFDVRPTATPPAAAATQGDRGSATGGGEFVTGSAAVVDGSFALAVPGASLAV